MQIEAILKEVTSIVARHAPKAQVLLFGSWAKGQAEPTSDLDIGLLAKNPLPFETLTQIRGEISAIPTLRKIDLVDLNAVDKTFRTSALAHHKVLTP